MFGWGKKKLAWEVQYAQNIYDGLVAHNEFGDMTALSLKIPTAFHGAYQNKILLQREMLCFVALMQAATPGTVLQAVMLAYGDLAGRKASERGLQLTRDQLADAALHDAKELFNAPYKWSVGWLGEFHADPWDTDMVVPFVDHCLRLFHAYTHGIEQTRPK
jgi:hypothetical protein